MRKRLLTSAAEADVYAEVTAGLKPCAAQKLVLQQDRAGEGARDHTSNDQISFDHTGFG